MNRLRLAPACFIVALLSLAGCPPTQTPANEPTIAPSGCTDEGAEDGDQDGYCPPSDCDDADPTILPGVAETASDGIDQDCDGQDDPVGSSGGRGVGGDTGN